MKENDEIKRLSNRIVEVELLVDKLAGILEQLNKSHTHLCKSVGLLIKSMKERER